MSFLHTLFGRASLSQTTTRRRRQQKSRCRPTLEVLEDRSVPALLFGVFGTGYFHPPVPPPGQPGGGTGPPICPDHAVVQNGANTGINGGARVSNVLWFDNGNAVTSLNQIRQGDTITVTFDTAANAATTEFSLVAYAARRGWSLSQQQLWADTTATFTGGGTHSLTVTLPCGFFQFDFVRGDAIQALSGSNTYNRQGRFIAGTKGGTQAVDCDCSGNDVDILSLSRAGTTSGAESGQERAANLNTAAAGNQTFMATKASQAGDLSSGAHRIPPATNQAFAQGWDYTLGTSLL